MDPLVTARPGLAAAIVGGDATTVARIRRLVVIDRAKRAQGPADPEERAEAIRDRLKLGRT